MSRHHYEYCRGWNNCTLLDGIFDEAALVSSACAVHDSYWYSFARYEFRRRYRHKRRALRMKVHRRDLRQSSTFALSTRPPQLWRTSSLFDWSNAESIDVRKNEKAASFVAFATVRSCTYRRLPTPFWYIHRKQHPLVPALLWSTWPEVPVVFYKKLPN